jgi:formate dehydrogenase maturation protein FdhE
MTANATIQVAVAKAREGVVYSPKKGALCPVCGKRCPVVSSPKWDGDIKVRYHKCNNDKCIIHTTGVTVKSVQKDVSNQKDAHG